MTQEEKYEALLEKAREMINNECSSEQTKAICLEFFPELRESEDERIREGLIALVNGTSNEILLTHAKAGRDILLAWLEKQKEQKPAEWSEEDEEILEEIISHIDTTSIQKIPARPGSAIGKSWIKFLKSLRPSWKPSDGPVWRIWKNGACGNSDRNPIAIVKTYDGYKLVSCLGTNGEKYIMLSDLEKLPGFNENKIDTI